jgi:regulatory protein
VPARPRSRETPAEARARRAAVDDPAVVLDALARLLEVRSRSIAEVSRRLTEAGYRAELVQGAVERFVALGYLDDAAFARAWVESRDRAHPRGARALRDELRRRGLAADVVEAALAAREAASEGVDPDAGAAALDGGRVSSATSDREAAARLLARRQGALLREADPRRLRSKAYGLLARSGFDPDVCREAVSSWMASTGPGTAEPE